MAVKDKRGRNRIGEEKSSDHNADLTSVIGKGKEAELGK